MKDDVKHEIKNIPLVIAAEVKKAKELADELEAKREKTNADVTTHENFFVLPVSHGFWKLQPKQSEALGRQWLEMYVIVLMPCLTAVCWTSRAQCQCAPRPPSSTRSCPP